MSKIDHISDEDFVKTVLEQLRVSGTEVDNDPRLKGFSLFAVEDLLKWWDHLSDQSKADRKEIRKAFAAAFVHGFMTGFDVAKQEEPHMDLRLHYGPE